MENGSKNVCNGQLKQDRNHQGSITTELIEIIQGAIKDLFSADVKMIRDLRPYKTAWRIQVNVLHSWRQYTEKSGETFECILADSQSQGQSLAINKSQGQSLAEVGLYLPNPVFSHGQLYVALSRVTSKKSLRVLILDKEGKPQRQTMNVVFKEVFQNLEKID